VKRVKNTFYNRHKSGELKQTHNGHGDYTSVRGHNRLASRSGLQQHCGKRARGRVARTILFLIIIIIIYYLLFIIIFACDIIILPFVL